MKNNHLLAQFLISTFGMNAAQAKVVSLMCNYRDKAGIEDLRTARELIDLILEHDYQETTGEILPKTENIQNAFGEWANEIYTKMAKKLGVDLKDIDSADFEESKPNRVDPYEKFGSDLENVSYKLARPPEERALDYLQPMFISKQSAELVLSAIMSGEVPGVTWTGDR